MEEKRGRDGQEKERANQNSVYEIFYQWNLAKLCDCNFRD